MKIFVIDAIYLHRIRFGKCVLYICPCRYSGFGESLCHGMTRKDGSNVIVICVISHVFVTVCIKVSSDWFFFFF